MHKETRYEREQRCNAWAKKTLAQDLIPGYPYDHNPYLKHDKTSTCFKGCVHNLSPVERTKALFYHLLCQKCKNHATWSVDNNTFYCDEHKP